MEFLKYSLVLAVASFATGCSHLSYLVQAGLGQLSLYNHERPLQEVIDDPATSSEVGKRLKWVPEIKKTVEIDLDVKATSNYTTYVDLKRPYVIWSITAAEPFRLKIKEWYFPIVGSFPYLGFFKENKAREWMKEYEEKGFDVSIRGVGAYSTLGYLRDPLLSSMLSRNKADLVNLIFHETTHGQIYLNGQGSFNEQVASFIGDYGERNWIVKTYGPKSVELKVWESEREDRRKFGSLLKTFAEELKIYYESSAAVPIEDRKLFKIQKFGSFQKRLVDAAGSPKSFLARVAKRINNNAALLAFLIYEDDQYIFDLLEKKCGGNLKDSLRYLKSFAKDWESQSSISKLSPQSLLYQKLLANQTCLIY